MRTAAVRTMKKLSLMQPWVNGESRLDMFHARKGSESAIMTGMVPARITSA